MNKIREHRKIMYTVDSAEGLPCSVAGKEAAYDADGMRLTPEWDLPWPMPWIDKALSGTAKEKAWVSQSGTVRIQNDEEPDQWICVSYRSLIGLTVGTAAEMTAEAFGGGEAVVNCNGTMRYTYGELRDNIRTLAKGLMDLGLALGDNVAVWAVNSIEFVIAQFATALVGCVFVPVSGYEHSQHIEKILNKSGAKALIMQIGIKCSENIEKLYALCPELMDDAPGKLHAEFVPALRSVTVISSQEYDGTYKWSELLERGADSVTDYELDERGRSVSVDDPACMIFTSGSSGEPKGVLLSHANIIENAFAMSARMKLSPSDVVCVQVPMFHCFGCVAGTLTSVISGASMIMVDRFRPEVTLSIIERERCTVFSGVPTMFRSLLEAMEKKQYDISSLRAGIIAGASVDMPLFFEVQRKMKYSDLFVAYGLTETSPCVAMASAAEFQMHEGSVGAAIAGVEIKIADPNTGTKLFSKTGEICVRGYNVMLGYFGGGSADREAIDSEGYLHTGDAGRIAADGMLVVEGRYKDIIIRCGENISAEEIEREALSLGDVREACVVGVPHALYGEEVFCFVRLGSSASIKDNEIMGYLRAKLPSYKIPGRLTILNEFPKLPSGKCDKRQLKEMARDYLRSSSSC
jgi:fatty-acyl-CoA synthase